MTQPRLKAPHWKMDKLDKMLELRERFMSALKEKNTSILPAWPVNVAQKESQQVLRETVLKGVEEMFEALGHLKNWKPHRETEVVDFDKFGNQIVGFRLADASSSCSNLQRKF